MSEAVDWPPSSGRRACFRLRRTAVFIARRAIRTMAKRPCGDRPEPTESGSVLLSALTQEKPGISYSLRQMKTTAILCIRYSWYLGKSMLIRATTYLTVSILRSEIVRGAFLFSDISDEAERNAVNLPDRARLTEVFQRNREDFMIHVCISVLRFFPYSVCFFYSHNISIFHFLRRFFKDNVKKDAFSW